MDDGSELYSIYENILVMDIGNDSGKVCLELSRGLTARSSGVCKERKQTKVKASTKYICGKPRAQHVLFSNKENKPSIVSENAFESTPRFLLSGSMYAEYVVEKQFNLLPLSKQQFMV